MAIHKGRKYSPSHAEGVVMPRNRALGPVNRAVVFELPEATSSVRTLARAVDMSAVTIGNVAVETDLRAVVVGSLSTTLDIGVLVVRPVSVDDDVQMTIYHVLDLRPDNRAAIFRPMERSFDCALIALHRMMSDADVKQSIYTYLFRESHEIQV